MDPSPSETLYLRATGGDRSALDALLERYLPDLCAFVRARLGRELRRRESSADVVQSVCRELVARREGFEFQGELQFRGWLFISALNKIRSKQRFHGSAKRDMFREDGQEGASPDGGPLPDAIVRALAAASSPSQEAVGREQIEILEGALDALAEDHREVIALARIARLPHAEVARLMGRTQEAVRALLARAVLRLADELKARGVDPPP